MKPQIWKSQTGEAMMTPTKSDVVSWSAKASVIPREVDVDDAVAADLQVLAAAWSAR